MTNEILYYIKKNGSLYIRSVVCQQFYILLKDTQRCYNILWQVDNLQVGSIFKLGICE